MAAEEHLREIIRLGYRICILAPTGNLRCVGQDLPSLFRGVAGSPGGHVDLLLEPLKCLGDMQERV